METIEQYMRNTMNTFNNAVLDAADDYTRNNPYVIKVSTTISDDMPTYMLTQDQELTLEKIDSDGSVREYSVGIEAQNLILPEGFSTDDEYYMPRFDDETATLPDDYMNLPYMDDANPVGVVFQDYYGLGTNLTCDVRVAPTQEYYNAVHSAVLDLLAEL